MSFRVRLTLVAAAAVAFAVVLASAVVYVVVRDQLRAEVDEGLSDRAAQIVRRPLDAVPSTGRGVLPATSPGRSSAARPVTSRSSVSDGTTIRPRGARVPIPVNERVRGVAAGGGDSFFYDTNVDGTHLRVFTFAGAAGLRDSGGPARLTEVDDALDQIRTYLFVIALAGVAVAVGLGLLVSRAAVAPVTRLTEATERVTETGDLSERIDARGQDELSRLAGSFNTMLAALEESARAQRQLVADASHELRTPLTSLRTNFEVLMSERELPAGERRRLLDDVVEQIAEMTTLIAGLIELARGDEYPNEPEDVRLDLLTADAVERARRDRPGVDVRDESRRSRSFGAFPPRSSGRSRNLLDNAAKWSPPGGEVEVGVENGTVTVRDHGPGIADEDLPFVFDRFYRSRSARTMPGSGLGLAIVRQTAEAHGGSVIAERAEGGGTRVILRAHGRPEHRFEGRRSRHRGFLEPSQRRLRVGLSGPLVSWVMWQPHPDEGGKHAQTPQEDGHRRRRGSGRRRRRRSGDRRDGRALAEAGERGDRQGRGQGARRRAERAHRRAQEGAQEPGRRGSGRRPPDGGAGSGDEGADRRRRAFRSSGSGAGPGHHGLHGLHGPASTLRPRTSA